MTNRSQHPFSCDDRGVSTVIGAVLLFGFLIIALATFQAQVVPAETKQVEFDHSLAVQNDVQNLRDAILRTASTGLTQPVGVQLGARYPQRTFFVNPPPASGQLRVSPFETQLAIKNVHAVGDDETSEYWNGETQHYTTSYIRYRPSYQRFHAAPTTVYASSVGYNAHTNGQELALTDQQLIRGNRISLVTLEGEFTESGVQRASVSPTPVSSSTRSIAVGATDEPITLSIPTKLNETTWRRLLADQLDENGGNIVNDPTVSNGVLTIELDTSQTYTLRMAKVTLRNTTQTTPAYLTKVGSTGDTYTVEVRDKFNNPVAGVPVEVDGTEITTNAEGRGSYTYEDEGTLTFQIVGMTADEHRVSFTPDQKSPTEPVDSGAISLTWDGPNNGDDLTVDASTTDQVELTVGTRPVVEALDLEFALGNSTVGSITTDAQTDSNGEATVDFEPAANGTVAVYAVGGGDSIVRNITVVNAGSATDIPGNETISGNPDRAFDDVDDDGRLDSGETTYSRSELSNFDDESVNLVIPESIGQLSEQNDPITIRAKSITTAVAIDTQNRPITLVATNGVVRTGERVSSKNRPVTIRGKRVDISETTIEADNAPITIAATEAGGGAIRATGATISSKNRDIRFESVGDIHLERATIDTHNGKVTANLNGDYTLYLEGTTVSVKNGPSAIQYSPDSVREEPNSAEAEPA